MQVKRYGWRPDRPDPRDRIYNLEERVFQATQLPKQVSLRYDMPAVYDQGQLGSCTANADGALFEYQSMRQNEGLFMPSRLFLYYEERRLGGYPVSEDTGAEIRDGIKVLVSEGVPPESEWPYNINRFAEKPPAACYTDARKHEATVYQRIVQGPGAPMRTALAKRNPIAFGFPVPDYFEGDWDPSSQPLALPDGHTQYIGGHATVVVGYDFSLQRFHVPVFEVRNSWGPDWGDNGYFWMDYRWFDKQGQLASDLWIVQHVT